MSDEYVQIIEALTRAVEALGELAEASVKLQRLDVLESMLGALDALCSQSIMRLISVQISDAEHERKRSAHLN